MPRSEQEIRQEHPDWNDEQVAAEVAREAEENRPGPTPAPTPSDADRDAAFARERRAREEAEKRAKEAEDKLAEEARKKAEDEGRWKELADEEKAKREGLEGEQRKAEARRNAERAAGDLKFKDTGYALYLLQQDQVDLSDPSAVKAALDVLAQDRKDLITGSAPPPSGGPGGGAGGDPPKLTREQVAGMTPQQIAKLDPEVLNTALAG